MSADIIHTTSTAFHRLIRTDVHEAMEGEWFRDLLLAAFHPGIHNQSEDFCKSVADHIVELSNKDQRDVFTETVLGAVKKLMEEVSNNYQNDNDNQIE